MIWNILKATCEWCGNWEETSMSLDQEKFRRRLQKRGWETILDKNGRKTDFCCNECKQNYINDRS